MDRPDPASEFALTPRAERVRVPLRVLPARPRRSSIARWRAGVLIGVHVLMVAHVLHWWITGRSLGRFVLSDSMRTLELGEINPGFVLFAAALLVTALFGRFLCGWVCHMGALQDLCAWLLRRAGVRPRLFRSRLLGFVPLAAACYMFAWPTAKREVIRPALEPFWPGVSRALAAPPRPVIAGEWVTDDLWEGLPSWGVAVPFLLLCGFGTVYFLGARGLCRYGCPYGGFLLPAEQLAVGRVAVDASRCDQCGLCTAACTAGVRVHDEVRLHGSVTDRNCIRSFDCIGACPSRALSFSLSRPALLARGRGEPIPGAPRLGWGEEVLCLAVFAGVFFAARGLYERVPMFLALTLGVLAAFLAWKTWRLSRDANVRLGPWPLKMHGRLRRAGCVHLAAVALLAFLTVHSAAVQVIRARAAAADDRVTVGFDEATGPGGASAAQRAAAREALGAYRLARPFWRGGIALAGTPSDEVRAAWMHVVLGEGGEAERALRRLVPDRAMGAGAAVQLARLMASRGDSAGAERELQAAVMRHPRAAAARDALVAMWLPAGRVGEAEGLYRRVLARWEGDPSARVGLGRVLVLTGRAEEGLAELRRAAREWAHRAWVRRELAVALHWLGRADEAAAELRAAAEDCPASRASLLALAERLSPG